MTAPTLQGLAPTLNVQEDQTVLIDADVTFADVDGDFDGGTVVVSGLVTGDVVSVQDVGSGTGQIGFDSGSGAVSYEGVQIGTLSGGTGSTTTILLNASATSAAVEALIESLTFTATSDVPTETRVLTISVTDAATETLNPNNIFTEISGSGNPFDGVDIGTNSAPALVDIDGDGDFDMIAGRFTGVFNQFENVGDASSASYLEQTGSDNLFDGVDVGFRSTITFVDIDNDGDFDAFVPGDNLDVAFYINQGTSIAGNFGELTGADNPLNGFMFGSVRGFDFADLDNDGDYDAFIGAESGLISFLRNEGDAENPVFTLVSGSDNPFDGVDVGFGSAPAFVDIDNDGDLDAFIGSQTGILHFYRNDGDVDSPVFTEVTGADNPFNGFATSGHTNPTFADLDGDGNVDALVGEADGVFSFFQGSVGDTVSIEVTVAGVEDAPTVTGLTDRGAAEDTTGSPDFSGVTIADTDTAGNITVTITATDTGAVLGAVDGSGVGAGVVETASGNNVVTLVGTAADITTYLSNASAITYTSSLNRETDDTISIQADDGVSTPNAASTATIVITPVNDLPTASDETITINEDTSYTFAASEFNFADVDTGAALASVRIDTLTLNSGTFRLSGVDVSATDVIAVADINAGNLVYTPGPDDFGDGLLTFTFSVNDGTGFAASTSTMTITVANVAEPEPDPVKQSGDTEDNVISGGGADDTLRGGDGDDQVSGGGGNDLLLAGPGDTGDDTVDGGKGNDTIGGGAGADFLEGGEGADILFGGAGNDEIYVTEKDNENGDQNRNEAWAGAGDDTVIGGLGADVLGGGGGQDAISAGGGSDTVYGGSGGDSLFGDAGNDQLGGGGDSDTLNGGAGNDTIFGGASDDKLMGGNDNDTLFGGAGDDTVDGGNGDDILWAGGGNDDLAGGPGADTFTFGSVSGNDTVTDFGTGADTLDLRFASTDFASVAEVQAAATNTTQGGQSGVLIDLGDGDSVFVVGLTVAGLTASTVTV